MCLISVAICPPVHVKSSVPILLLNFKRRSCEYQFFIVFYLIRSRIDFKFIVSAAGEPLFMRPLTNLTQKSAPSRIVLLSSSGHQYAKIDWNNLGREKNYNSLTSYANSKLANILHGVELSKRLEGLCRNPLKILF